MLHLRSARSAFLLLGALFFASTLSACGQDNHPSAVAGSGSANVSVQALGAVPLGQVTLAISGPPLSTPRSVTLSPQGSGGTYGAMVSTLPVGSNYLFTVTATDTSNVVAYRGQATNVAILRNHVTTVVITAQADNPPAPFVNTVPTIESLVVSSTNIAPGETISAKVEAKDLDAGDTITFAWSANPAVGGFSPLPATAATTTWTAPSTEGDVTLTIQVQDNHGATVSASIVIHVSNANGKGQASVNVNFNNWPVVTDVLATPGWIALGAPTSLSVTANDSDGDSLSYLWTTNGTCTAGSFTNPASATPTFTLPASATDGHCEFDVAVSDGRGGSANGTLFLPVGAPPSIIAPAIVDAAQSASVVDPSATVLFQVEAMDPQGSALIFQWSARSGSLSGQQDTATSSSVVWTAPDTCTGGWQVTVTVTDAQSAVTTQVFTVDCALLVPGSLVISSSTYDRTVGAIASLAVGSKLAGSATATAKATSGNNYVTVWNNASVDSSFGVTSPIQLTDLDPATGRILGQVAVPADQVVTSFPSKSELGLHVTNDLNGAHLVFVGYAGAGIGALDVSNSDAVAGQDPTNPVTFAFGSSYAFSRTVVSMDGNGHFTYTPTTVYGGNNGRSALLGSNGLYYAVGNANNGNASTFGPNGTNPDVTETTGLEVVTPINGSTSSVSIPPNNSAEVNPLIQNQFGTAKADKPGKDNNYRGITEFGGALYFTKGSGSNGMDTVYTVSTLPTVANAATTTIGVVPGFPTDSAKATGGNFTPFAVFFANATTMYVSDEGSGDALDKNSHAGLEKWSLVSGFWQLDYVLTQGLIGVVDSNLTGPDGPYPAVTTVGLRNLTGVVNGDKVTLWATTSTSSASGDNGADPNRVVVITDQLSATTMTSAVAAESFQTVQGPTYGTVYRGVAFVN
jgi:hypothetical protein